MVHSGTSLVQTHLEQKKGVLIRGDINSVVVMYMQPQDVWDGKVFSVNQSVSFQDNAYIVHTLKDNVLNYMYNAQCLHLTQDTLLVLVSYCDVSTGEYCLAIATC